jgi:hypothetical protein
MRLIGRNRRASIDDNEMVRPCGVLVPKHAPMTHCCETVDCTEFCTRQW